MRHGSQVAVSRRIRLTVPQSRAALAEQGIFFGQRPTATGRVAFLFPGQGLQCAGMLADLVRQNKAAREAVREVDAALALLGYPSFDEISADADQLLGADVLRTQLAMLVADLIMFRTLTSLGVQPAVVSAAIATANLEHWWPPVPGVSNKPLVLPPLVARRSTAAARRSRLKCCRLLHQPEAVQDLLVGRPDEHFPGRIEMLPIKTCRAPVTQPRQCRKSPHDCDRPVSNHGRSRCPKRFIRR